MFMYAFNFRFIWYFEIANTVIGSNYIPDVPLERI